MALGAPLDGQVAGFDPRKFRSRHLVVYHRMDACRVTKPASCAASRSRFGTETIEMDGGTSTGDDCEARACHGYNGIEAATVDKIKAWISGGI